MKAGQFSNEQIVAILQEAERGEKPILALCKDKGNSEATFYAWRKRFGGLQTRDVQRLREVIVSVALASPTSASRPSPV